MWKKRDWTGWVLEDTLECKVIVKLGKPLGDLPPAQLDILRDAFGEAQFNMFSSYNARLEALGLSEAEATRAGEALNAAGFRARVKIEHEYYAHMADPFTRAYIDDVSIDEMEKIAAEMIAAGVPVIRKRA